MTFVIIAGLAAFGAGFVLLWSLGSWMVGGPGFPWRSAEQAVSITTPAVTAPDYSVEPLVDLIAFRDLSYTPVKGIYVGSYAVQSNEWMPRLLGLADRTEINAFVIDVKDDWGKITYAANVPMAKKLGLIENRIKDIDALLATLAKHNIVPIARVVCFKDTRLSEARPDLSVRSSKGGKWADWKGLHYTNPYKHEVWEYLVQIAEDAARHGFREIQFDYVRFPSDGPISEAVYPGEYCAKEDAIAGFLAYARQRLEKLGVWVSADIFGIAIMDTRDAAVIGQRYWKIAQNVDIVCPMVYPSHYESGSYGIQNPNASPYETVSAAMKETAKRLAGTGAMGRPWLQDFSLRGVEYGVERVKAQIRAAEEQGFTEWLLWDPALEYTEGALRPEGG
ncbi:MAG: putative glycoside hydrolase [Thermoleophilia bacterium]|nr:putative glycoside hydrolase [Thermoleophilia bacterium]